jgi:hypothetical protein
MLSVFCWPIAAVSPLIESVRQPSKGLRTKCWLQTVDRCANAAAVRAIASGSQHRTVSAGQPQIPVREPRPCPFRRRLIFASTGPGALRPCCTPVVQSERRRYCQFIAFLSAGMAALQLQDFGVDVLMRLDLDHRRGLIGPNVRLRLAHPTPRPVVRKPAAVSTGRVAPREGMVAPCINEPLSLAPSLFLLRA